MQHPNHSAIERHDPVPEIAGLLATAYLRSRMRWIKREIAGLSENSLDDVANSGRLRTAENRTLEKGAWT